MRNVTITLDEETAGWARLEAARRDTSVSRLVGDMLRGYMQEASQYERARRSYATRAAAPLRELATPYPPRDELYER